MQPIPLHPLNGRYPKGNSNKIDLFAILREIQIQILLWIKASLDLTYWNQYDSAYPYFTS